MSDPQLRGNITWLLMTARIYNLSPDLRREGRVGDMVVPVLDPSGEDREAFLRWTLAKVVGGRISEEAVEQLLKLTEDYSAASFASLRSDLEAASLHKNRLSTTSDETDELTLDEIIAVVEDRILPDIGPIRRYQTLQALVNCTRKSLLPGDYSPEIRESWVKQIAQLEVMGVRG